MRITGGELRGLRVMVPKDREVRPTQDMVRQALFSSLASRVPGCRFLDLFAGSGAVGLDAWSRGARQVWWVERNPRVVRVLRENVSRLCAEAAAGRAAVCRAVEAEALRFLQRRGGGAEFDIVFADPPYARAGEAAWLRELLVALRSSTVLAPGGTFVMESAVTEAIGGSEGWEQVLDRRYGESRLRAFVRAEA